LFAAIGLAALAAGSLLWLASPGGPPPAGIAPAALYATSFRTDDGTLRSLGTFEGQVLVLNFWATWCAPCRAEMPAFSRLQARFRNRGIQFVGLSADEPAKVRAFLREVPVEYPLWTGESGVGELSRRLGNHAMVLPHTVLIDPSGHLLESRIGPYAEDELAIRLSQLASKR
jgi:peroxiredoxin